MPDRPAAWLTRVALRLLADLCPAEPEVHGLLGLMLLQHLRSAAGVGLDGALVRLPDQDRWLWDSEQIEVGLGLVRAALRSALELAKNGLERRILLAQLAGLDADASSRPAQ